MTPSSRIRTYSRRNTSSNAFNSLMMKNLMIRKQVQRSRKRGVLITDLPLPDENHHLLDDSFEPQLKTEDPFDLICRIPNNNVVPSFKKTENKSSAKLSNRLSRSCDNSEEESRRKLRNTNMSFNRSISVNDVSNSNKQKFSNKHIENVPNHRHQVQPSYYSSLSSLSISHLESSVLPHNSTADISYDGIFNKDFGGKLENNLVAASSTPKASASVSNLVIESYQEVCSWDLHPNITPKDFETTPVRKLGHKKQLKTPVSTKNLGKNNLTAVVKLMCSNDPRKSTDYKLKATPKVQLYDIFPLLETLGISNIVTCSSSIKGYTKEEHNHSLQYFSRFTKTAIKPEESKFRYLSLKSRLRKITENRISSSHETIWGKINYLKSIKRNLNLSLQSEQASTNCSYDISNIISEHNYTMTEGETIAYDVSSDEDLETNESYKIEENNLNKLKLSIHTCRLFEDEDFDNNYTEKNSIADPGDFVRSSLDESKRNGLQYSSQSEGDTIEDTLDQENFNIEYRKDIDAVITQKFSIDESFIFSEDLGTDNVEQFENSLDNKSQNVKICETSIKLVSKCINNLQKSINRTDIERSCNKSKDITDIENLSHSANESNPFCNESKDITDKENSFHSANENDPSCSKSKDISDIENSSHTGGKNNSSDNIAFEPPQETFIDERSNAGNDCNDENDSLDVDLNYSKDCTADEQSNAGSDCNDENDSLDGDLNYSEDYTADLFEDSSLEMFQNAISSEINEISERLSENYTNCDKDASPYSKGNSKVYIISDSENDADEYENCSAIDLKSIGSASNSLNSVFDRVCTDNNSPIDLNYSGDDSIMNDSDLSNSTTCSVMETDDVIVVLSSENESCSYDSDGFETIEFVTPSKQKSKFGIGKSFRRSLINQRLVLESCTCVDSSICSCSKRQNRSLMSDCNRRLSVRVIPETLISKNKEKHNLTILENYASNNGLDKVDCTSNVVQNLDYRESIGESLTNVKVNNAHIHDSLECHIPTPVTAREIVLRRCGQAEPEHFSKCYPEITLQHCTKIGEGVYGEVFLFRNAKRQGSVMKVIPIEGNQMVNGERQKKFEEILSEIIIAGELSNLRNNSNNNTTSYSEVQRIRCVCGCYPKRLIDLWDLYDEVNGSENDSPDMFMDDQLYIVLELANGGKDMEAFLFNNAVQAYSLFKQTACALAIAEASLQFEHRDLHWGNLLITETDKNKVLRYRLNGNEFLIKSCGVEVSLIDFTLSRITYDGVCIFNDLSLDPELFTATGDYQFQIYKLMKEHNNNEWKTFRPYTNVLWMHYLLDKIIKLLRYKNSKSKIHTETIKQLQSLKDRILQYSSAVEFVNDEILS